MNSQQPLIALVDCNNFYVSCERVFRPDLHNKPVAVLSNNDGCIVSRSQEVKDLGVKMAVPVHQISHLIKRHKIHLFSSNYTLYADMSNRVMQCLEGYTPKLEVYSIDESFLDLTGINPEQSSSYGHAIKNSVYRTSGIPVCVGMGPTKTLAKLANYAAKKWKKTDGILDISNAVRREKLMRIVPVSEIWGIGRQTSKRLQQMGINSAYDLSRQPAEAIQSQFNIVIARTVMELNGVTCLSLDDIPTDKKQIVCSRSFKKRLTEYQDLAEALSNFCSRAAEKLRAQQSVTGAITVFINTNPHTSAEPQYQRSVHTRLSRNTNDTRQITRSAKQLLMNIFRTGYRYHQCGVQLGHIQPLSELKQTDLFDFEDNNLNKSHELMMTMDKINQRYPNALNMSSNHIHNDWQTPVKYLSNRYTTDWNELAIAKCQ